MRSRPCEPDAGVDSGAVSAGVGVGVLLVGGCDGASGVTVGVYGGMDVDMPGGSTSPGAEVGVAAGIVVASGSGVGVAVSTKGAQTFTFAT